MSTDETQFDTDTSDGDEDHDRDVDEHAESEDAPRSGRLPAPFAPDEDSPLGDTDQHSDA